MFLSHLVLGFWSGTVSTKVLGSAAQEATQENASHTRVRFRCTANHSGCSRHVRYLKRYSLSIGLQLLLFGFLIDGSTSGAVNENQTIQTNKQCCQAFELPLVSAVAERQAIQCCQMCQCSKPYNEMPNLGQRPTLAQFPLHAHFSGVPIDRLHAAVAQTNEFIAQEEKQNKLLHGGLNTSKVQSCFAKCAGQVRVSLVTSSFHLPSAVHNLERLTTTLLLFLKQKGLCIQVVSLGKAGSFAGQFTRKDFVSVGNMHAELPVCHVNLQSAQQPAAPRASQIADILKDDVVVLNDASHQVLSWKVAHFLRGDRIFVVFNNQQSAVWNAANQANGTTTEQVQSVLSVWQWHARCTWEAMQLRAVHPSLCSGEIGHRTALLRSQVSYVWSPVQLLSQTGYEEVARLMQFKREQLLRPAGRKLQQHPALNTRNPFTYVLPHNEGKLHYSMTPAIVALAIAALTNSHHRSVRFLVWMHSEGSFQLWVDSIIREASVSIRSPSPSFHATGCCPKMGTAGYLLQFSDDVCCRFKKYLHRWGEAQVLSHLRQLFQRVPFLEQPEYFTMLQASSVYLDAYPVGGGTTSMDALFFGVPVITFPSWYRAGQLSLAHYLSMGLKYTINSDPHGPPTCDFSNRSTFSLPTLDTRKLRLVASSWKEYVSHALWHLEHPAESSALRPHIASRANAMFNDGRAVEEWFALLNVSST